MSNLASIMKPNWFSSLRIRSDHAEDGHAVRSRATDTVAAPQPVAVAPMTRDKRLFLGTGLAGSFLVNMSAQFIPANIADIQGGIGASADEASWLATVYTMASLAGIIASGPLVKTLGLSRYVMFNAVVFGVTAMICAGAPSLPVMIGLRSIQGLAAGGFGPVAFLAVFMVTGGPRLPFGLTLLAFVLLFPITSGPLVSGFLEDSFGWRTLFLIQTGVGAVLLPAAFAWLPRSAVNWEGLKADWFAIALLSWGVAMLILVLNQGTRQFWFESDMLVWCSALGIGAWAGFIFLARFSPLPLIAPQLLVARTFAVPIALNLVFRAGLAVTAYLVPQFLAVTQGYRPLEIAQITLWAATAQLLALPLVWWLLHRLDARLVMGVGLLLCGLGTALLINGTNLASGDQFRLTLVLFGAGQLLFLAPDILLGASSLKPQDLPTASLAFNLTTVGGTTLGVGLVSNFVTERQKLHSNVITEGVSLYSAFDADRVTALANNFGSRLVDDAAATARAVAVIASAARREAWVLAFNDGFLVVAGILLVSALGVLLIRLSKPLHRVATLQQGDGNETLNRGI